MYGLVPALMEGRRQRNAEEEAAANQAMRQQELAMRQAQHNAAMQEATFRMEGLRRQRQSTDDLLKEFDAEGAQAPGLTLPAQRVAPEGAGFMEANGVNPAPVAAVGLARPGLTGVDRRVARTALETGNFGDYYKLRDRNKAELQDKDRKAEFNRLMALSEQDLEAAFKPLNMHPGVQGMLKFDPKSGQFLLTSDVPGLTTQTMSKEELVGSMMSVWEAGNGDFTKGLNGMLASAQRRRELDNTNFDRSTRLAGLDADVHFKNRSANATDAQRAEQTRHNQASEAIDAARLKMQREQHAQTKVVPPEILKELSALEQQYIGTDDPKARATIERQYQMTLSRAGAAIGKPMGIPNNRPAPDIKTNPDGSVIKDGVLYVPNPKKPGEFVAAKGLGPTALDRAMANDTGGNAPAAGLAPPESPELRTARVVQNMNDAQFAAYKKLQENQPLTPRERELLRAAGIQ